MWITLSLTLLFIAIGSYYFRAVKARKKKRRSLDLKGHFHKWANLGNGRSYYCSICEKLLCFSTFNLSFTSMAKKCIKCRIIVHRYCLKMKGSSNLSCKSCVKREHNPSRHQWVRGNDEDDVICYVCGQFCNNLYAYAVFRCLWCQKTRHEDCKGEEDDECDFGEYKDMVIFPTEVIHKTTTNGSSSVELKIQKKKKVVLFIVNRMSGPQFGEEVLQFLYRNFNPIQVIDLLDEGLSALNYFKGVDNLRIIVGGGDGTVTSIASCVKSILGDIPLIPMPLGTGNDLSRALGWGKGLSVIPDLINYLELLRRNQKSIYLDRWRLKVVQGVDSNSMKSKESRDKILNEKDLIFNQKFMLYCGIGLGAKFSYQFNTIREKFPNLFKSRLGNNFMYGQMGALETVNIFNIVSEKLIIDKEMKLFDLSGRSLPLSTAENLVFQNTRYWGGGCFDIWKSCDFEPKSMILDNESVDIDSIQSAAITTKQFNRQSYSDSMLESLSMRNVLHMGQVQLGLKRPQRVAQSMGYFLVYEGKETVYIHLDGEGYYLKGPFTFSITQDDKLLMNINETGKDESNFQVEVIKVMNWATAKKHISVEQKKILLEKFSTLY